MTTRTYLDQCLKDGLTARWPDTTMPIRIYIAPFRWYDKAKEKDAYLYLQMVLDCLHEFRETTQGKVAFHVVNQLNESQIDLSWRRVDRKSLGHCQTSINDQSLIYSAEIKIGISDGIIHGQYEDPNEIRHTIIHELCHAVGIHGHSPYVEDIMYVPHEYGVISHLSPRDVDTLHWLYTLPSGFDYLAIGQKHQLESPFSIHDVIECLAAGPRLNPAAIAGRQNTKNQVFSNTVVDPFFEKAAPRIIQENPQALEAQQDILTQMGKFHLATQNIQPKLPPGKKP